MALAFATNSLPYRLVEDPYFQAAFQHFDTNQKLSRYLLREKIFSIAENIKEDIVQKLSDEAVPVTIAIDGWTNVRTNKVLNMLLISAGKPYFFASIENFSEKSDSKWIVSKVEEKIQYLKKNNIIIVALTTDNAPVMKLSSKRLSESYPYILDIPCAAHIMQLCLKHISDLNVVNRVVTIVKLINASVKGFSEKRHKLQKLQEMDSVVPIELLDYTVTRWSSLLDCIERQLKLSQYLTLVLKDEIAEIPWKDIEKLYNYLLPFKVATNKIQEDNASLYTVSKSLSCLHQTFENDADVFEIKDVVLNIISKYWGKYLDMTLLYTSNLFNFDFSDALTEQELNKIICFLQKWGSKYIEMHGLTKLHDKLNLDEQIEIQFKEFYSNIEQFQHLRIKVKKYKTLCINTIRRFKPEYIWVDYKYSHPELYHIAKGILSVCPTEACVERSFSAQDDIHTQDRNRLDDSQIEAEMMIKMNISDFFKFLQRCPKESKKRKI